jgi:long-chain acyl-CoA synthetase
MPMEINLARAFAASVEQHSAKIAIFWGDAEIGYAELWARSRWMAEQLREKFGVKAGDRVGVWLRNCPEYVPAIYGILLAGGVVVPINNFLKPDEVSHILNDAGINMLISEQSLSEAFPKLQGARAGLKVFEVEQMQATPGANAPSNSERKRDDLAVIIYTSGTTGKPKGAMLSHGNLLSNVESCRQVLEAVSFDRFVVLLPMFHSFMLCVCIFLPLTVGGSMVLVKSLHPPKNIVVDIMRRQATILPAIPPLFRALSNAQLPGELPLRLCISGAAPLPLEILREWNAKFTIPLIEGYGLSEASPVVSINPIRGPWKAGSIGVPIANVEVSVQDEEGRFLKDGEVGEICVRGGNVMQGYWNKPEETAKAMRDGWLLTGDVGYRDPDGYFFITDRKKDMLLVNGINVYPREIEEVIYTFPGIREAAVISRPDERKGEQPIAYVAMNEGATLNERELIHYLRERLADYKVPRQVNVLPALPRNATGKVLKTALRSLSQTAPSEAK